MPKHFKQAIFSKEYEAILESWITKVYICFCLADEDSFKDEILECMVEELAVLKSSRYVIWGPYRQRDSISESMLYDGKYLTDDEFLSHFCMDRSCVMQLNNGK